MARVVLVLIEFAQAICDSRKILPVLQHSNRQSMTILQPNSGLYIAGHYTGHTGHYTDHYIL